MIPITPRNTPDFHLWTPGWHTDAGSAEEKFMAMRILAAALAIALMTASAGAQGVGGVDGNGFGGRHKQHGKTAKTAAPKPKVDEKAYSAALKTLPDKPFDAWNGVR
jgi:hypothetical protein